MTRPSLVPSSLALAAATALAAPALAQSSDAEIRADIDYARGLAADWSFVGLATEVLDDARKKSPSGKLREQLALTECEVYGQGARIERDDTRRNELFHAALEQYQDFLVRYPSSEFRSAAETGMVTTAVNFSKSVDIALETLTGEAADELNQKKIGVLEEAVKLTAQLVDAIEETPSEERTAQQLADAAGLMLNRGRMLADIGGAQTNGTYFFEQAIVSLENMVFFFGEGTPQSLRAYQALGDVFLKMGQVEDAYYMYEGVLNQSWPADPDFFEQLVQERKDQGDPITEQEWGQRYLFLEISMEGLIDCSMQLGNSELACAYAMHFYNSRQEKGLTWQPAGYTSLLKCAEALLDAGGYIGGNQATGEARWFATEEEMKDAVRSRRQHDTAVSFALKLANTVNNDNKGNYLQVRAQKLISEIASRPGITVSVDVLVQAAEGEFYDGEYEAAIESFKRVLATLETRDSAEQLEYGAKVYNFLANSYRRSDRFLEAAMAFRAGHEANSDDVEFAEKNANGWRLMVKSLADSAPGDDTITAELQTAEAEYLKVAQGGGVDRIHYNNGDKAAREESWAEAIGHYEQVAADSDWAEKARVEINVCRFRNGEASAALKGFSDYLGWVVDPSNAVDSPVRKQKRAESVATAEFYQAYINYLAARKADDAGRWAKVAELLAGFPERHPQQTKLAPLTLRLLMEARLGAGDRAGAREAIDQLVADFQDSSQTAKGAVTFYNSLRGLQESAADAEATTILREMAEFLKIANSIMGTDFTRMRNESRHWMDLGEFVEAERVLSALATEFTTDAARADSMTKYVLPDLGEVLLANHKVADAKAILAPLVLDETNNPTKNLVLNYCRSVSGWLVGGGTGDPVKEIPGAGGTEEEWQAVVDNLHRIWQRDKWECQWYEYRLMHTWAYVAWSREDSRKMDSAKAQMTSLKTNLSKGAFIEIEETCAEESDAALREAFGGGVLQSRFQYLDRLVR